MQRGGRGTGWRREGQRGMAWRGARRGCEVRLGVAWRGAAWGDGYIKKSGDLQRLRAVNYRIFEGIYSRTCSGPRRSGRRHASFVTVVVEWEGLGKLV